MDVLVPVDDSDCSARALQFAVEFADRFDAALSVVHISDAETDATDLILAHARAQLASSGSAVEPELVVRPTLETPTASRIGAVILDLVEKRRIDHVVMGHHGSGRVEHAILGSAAETVVRGDGVPVTVVP